MLMGRFVKVTICVAVALVLSGTAFLLVAGTSNAARTAPAVPRASAQVAQPELVPNPDGTTTVRVEGLPNISQPGKPMLPTKTLLLALPPGKVASDAVLVNPTWSAVPGAYVVSWGQPYAPSDGPMPSKVGKDESIYDSDEPWPPDPILSDATGKLREVPITRVMVCPFRYRAATGALEKLDSINVRLVLQDAPGPTAVSSDTLETLNSLSELGVDNLPQAQSWYTPSEDPDTPDAPEGAPQDDPDSPYAPSASPDIADYVFICPSALSTSIDPLKTYKESQGLTTNVTTTEWIYANCAGADNQAKIRQFLKDNYVAWGIDYVLFVGTDASVPMRRAYAPTGYDAYNDSVPTDYYYSDLSGDWDLNDDGLYGQWNVDDNTGGVDFYPEVMVGRIPSSTAATITNICNKIVTVSQDAGAWKHKMLIPGAVSNFENEDGSGWDATWGGVWGDYLKNDIATPAGFSSYTMYEKAGIVRGSPPLSPDPTACDQALTKANFISKFNEGYGVVTWWGHGNSSGAYRTWWASDDGDGVPEGAEVSSGSFIATSDTLSNTYPAIVFQVSCLNGEAEVTNNLSAKMLTSGASAVVGGTRITWYSVGWQNPYWGGNCTLGYLWTRQVVTNKHRVGKAIRMADLELKDDYWGDNNWDYSNMYGFNLFGDPSMKLDAEGPPTVTSVDPVTHLNNSTPFGLDLAGDNFMTGAQVKLTRVGQPDVEATAESVDSPIAMTCTFNLENVLYGAWNVVVTNPDDTSGTLPNGFTVGNVTPDITSITPNLGSGDGSVHITDLHGSNLRSYATVQLRKTGQPNITATNVTRISDSQITCDFDITGATAGLWNVFIDNGGGLTDTLTNAFTVSYTAPHVDSITPNTALNDGPVTITDLHGSNFVDGATVQLTKVGQSAINATGVTVHPGGTQIDCTLDLTGKVGGLWNVVVTNPDMQSSTLTNGFTIEYPAPTLSGITPSTGTNNGTVDITDLAGDDFRSGAAVKLTKVGETDIIASNISVVSPTRITCRFDLSGKAVGLWNVVVTNDDTKSATLSDAFEVTYPLPVVSSITPDSGVNTGSVNITDLAGQYFRDGATVKLQRGGQPDINGTSVVVVSPTRITCSFDLAGGAVGAWDVVVTNPAPYGGAGTLSSGFDIEHPSPTFASITPSTAENDELVNITDLAGTFFRPGVSVKLTRAGQSDINASSVVPVSPDPYAEQITCTFDLTGRAVGTWNVVITNSDGKSATGTNAFTIEYPPPEVAGIAPATGGQGSVIEITNLAGTGFRAGAAVRLTGIGPDIIATNVVAVSPTRITCSVDLTGASVGLRNVVVTNTDGKSDQADALFSVTEPPPPAVDSVSPASGTVAESAKVLNVAGSGFASGVTARLTRDGQPDIVGAVDYLSSTHFSVTFDLSGAAVGTWDLTVENPGGANDVLEDAFDVTYAAPQLGSVSPTRAYDDQSLSTFNLYGAGFRDGLSVQLVRSGQSVINGSSENAVSPTHATCALDLRGAEPGAWNVRVINDDGQSSTLAGAFTVLHREAPKDATWYLAEGTSDYGFETFVTIENPNSTAVTAMVTYMSKSGPRTRAALALPPMSQTTINPRDDIGATDFSTKVECKEGKTIAVDRRMTWTGAGASSPEAHSSIGVTAPAKAWYLAEGSSKWGFETWLLIQNPNDTEATCTVTYMTESDGPKSVAHKVAANSRASFNMETDVGPTDASIKVESALPVIPERAMYRNNRKEGHCSIGTTAPSKDFYLAEGSTDWGFTTYVLVQNPNPQPNTVTLTYMTPTGAVAADPFVMPPNSRTTVRANDRIPSKDISTRVSGSLPLIAERAMYWNTPSGESCHDSVGMSSPHTAFFLPDGETFGDMETWTLVQNPGTTPVSITVSYLTPSGAGNVTFTDTLAANSRKSYSMADKLPEARASVLVRCTTPGKKVMVERAMYWNSRGAGTDTIGGFADE